MNETALLDNRVGEGGAAVASAKAKEEEFIQLARESVESTINLPPKIRVIWEGLRRVYESGQVEAVRAVNGAFLHRLEQCLGLMRDALDQAKKAALLGGKPLPKADELAAGRSELEGLRSEALVEWQYPLPSSSEWALLWLDEHGDIYVGRSNVLLDTIVEETKAGALPEDIIRGYDTVQPADVHGAISYYQRYRDVVEAYLRRREADAEELRLKIEAVQPSKAERKSQIKERWSRRKAGNAAPTE